MGAKCRGDAVAGGWVVHVERVTVERRDLRTDNDCFFKRVKGLFLEEPEGKFRSDAQAIQLQPATPRGNQRIRHQPARARKELSNLQTAMQLMAVAGITDHQ